MGETVIIVNPAAGEGAATERAERLRQALQLGPTDLHVAASLDDARRTAEEAQGADAVVAVGGDGTWGAVADGLMRIAADARPPVGLLGVDDDAGPSLSALATALRGGAPRAIDVGYASDRDRYFVSSIVLDDPAKVARELPEHRPGLRKVLGRRSSQPPRPLVDLRPLDVTLRTEHGTEALRARALVVLNPSLPWRSATHPAVLELFALEGAVPDDLAHHFLEVVQDAEAHPERVRRSAREVTVETSELLSVEVDGEPAGTTPLTVRLVPEALRAYG